MTQEILIFDKAIAFRREGNLGELQGLRDEAKGAQEQVVLKNLARRLFRSHQAGDMKQFCLDLQAAVDLGLEEDRPNDRFRDARTEFVGLRQKYLPEALPVPVVSLRDKYVREERERLERVISTGTFRTVVETTLKEDDRLTPEKRDSFIRAQMGFARNEIAMLLFAARMTPRDSLWGTVAVFCTPADFARVQGLFFEEIRDRIATGEPLQFPEDQVWLEEWRDYFAAKEAQARPPAGPVPAGTFDNIAVRSAAEDQRTPIKNLATRADMRAEGYTQAEIDAYWEAQRRGGRAQVPAPPPEAYRESVFSKLRTLNLQNAGYDEIEKAEIELAPAEQAQMEEIDRREAAREEGRRIPYLTHRLYHGMSNGSWLDRNRVSEGKELLQQLFPAGDFVIREAAVNYWNALVKYERRDLGSGQGVHETKNTLDGAIDNEARVTADEFNRLQETADILEQRRKDFESRLMTEAMPEDEELGRLFTDMEAARVAAREARETVFKKRGDYFDGLAERAGIKKATWDGWAYQIEYEEKTEPPVAETQRPPIGNFQTVAEMSEAGYSRAEINEHMQAQRQARGQTGSAEPPAAGLPPAARADAGPGVQVRGTGLTDPNMMRGTGIPPVTFDDTVGPPVAGAEADAPVSQGPALQEPTTVAGEDELTKAATRRPFSSLKAGEEFSAGYTNDEINLLVDARGNTFMDEKLRRDFEQGVRRLFESRGEQPPEAIVPSEQLQKQVEELLARPEIPAGATEPGIEETERQERDFFEQLGEEQ